VDEKIKFKWELFMIIQMEFDERYTKEDIELAYIYTQREILKYIVLELRTFVLENCVSTFCYQYSQY